MKAREIVVRRVGEKDMRGRADEREGKLRQEIRVARCQNMAKINKYMS